MTQLNLGNVRMRFAGDYSAAAAYTPADIIRDPGTGDLYVPIVPTVPAGTALSDVARFATMMVAPREAVPFHVPGANYGAGQVVRSNSNKALYKCIQAASGRTSDPFIDATYWQPVCALTDGARLTGATWVEAVMEKSQYVSGATPTLNLSSATVFTTTLFGDVTFSVSNVPSQSWVRTLVVTTSAANALTYPANWDWGTDGPPDPFGATGGTMEIVFRAEGSGSVRASLSWRKDN